MRHSKILVIAFFSALCSSCGGRGETKLEVLFDGDMSKCDFFNKKSSVYSSLLMESNKKCLVLGGERRHDQTLFLHSGDQFQLIFSKGKNMRFNSSSELLDLVGGEGQYIYSDHSRKSMRSASIPALFIETMEFLYKDGSWKACAMGSHPGVENMVGIICRSAQKDTIGSKKLDLIKEIEGVLIWE